MPRATRNTNEYSGNEVSAPPNPNTWLKHKALTPRVAANESTTVLVRIAVPAAPAAAARRRDLPRPPATASTKGSGCRLRPGDLGTPRRRLRVPSPTCITTPARHRRRGGSDESAGQRG